MNKPASILIVFVLMIGGFAFSQQRESAPGWQYATIISSIYPSGEGDNVKTSMLWIGPDNRLEAETLDEFYESLSGEKKQRVNETDLLNCVGSEGWELVWVRENEIFNNRTKTTTFKRRQG